MSAIAGRVLIIPQGAYNPSSTYHMLDAVSYNGNSYIAKKTTQGNTPTADNEFWMLMSAGSAVASINDIGDVLITLPTDGQVLKYNATTQKWENGQDTGGLLPHLIIISEDGESEVKAVKGSTEIIATRTSAGHYECDVPEFGTWTIHAVLNGDDATVNLVVDTVKVYTVDDSHFHADITVTYPSGGTCSCSKSGETTLYATGSPYTFTVHSAGAWTITATAYEKTFTKVVNISSTGQMVYILVPDGATVTPTDDVQTLLACAGIGDSQITTLAELLADTTTLSAVINSNNAVDYMVRSTTWAVATALVPTMTDDTHPSGSVIYSSQGASDSGYKAFDNDTSTKWTSSSDVPQYIGYIFDSAINVYSLKVTNRPEPPVRAISNFKLQHSSDGENWVDEETFTNTDNVALSANKFISGGTNKYIGWRLYISSAFDGSQCGIGELQFYSASITDNATAMTYIGLNNYAANTLLADATWCNAICNSTYFESVLNVSVPTMTDNTHPSGVAKVEPTVHSNGQAYKMFDKVYSASNYAAVSENTNYPHYYSYEFTEEIPLYRMDIYNGRNGEYSVKNCVLQHLENGSWVDDDSFTVPAPIGTTTRTFDGSIKSTSFRIKATSGYYTNYKWSCIFELQFYGREDV